MRTGQAEFIALLGVIAIAVVVIVFAYQSYSGPQAPSGIAQEQKAVKESFLTLARSSADSILELMESHGGYLNTGLLEKSDYEVPPFEVFGGLGIPYWQACENDLSPSLQQAASWMETGLELAILNRVGELEKSFEKEVDFDTSSLRVRANILDSRIDFLVSLPTEVEGFPIQQPYQFSIPTKFGRIFSFAKDLSQELSKNRQLEYFSIASLHFSSPSQKDGHPKLPVSGVLTRCGETIFRSSREVGDSLKESIAWTVATTQGNMWVRTPIDQSQPRVYSLESVNGKKYQDLDARMLFPDNFQLVSNPVVITNTKLNVDSPLSIFDVRQCVTFYSQRYSYSFPLVFRVEDDLSGNHFNLATLSSVQAPSGSEAMLPASCSPGNPGGGYSETCSALSCQARLAVLDSYSSPLEGAIATFGGCLVGESNSQGVIEGPVLCGEQELNVYLDSGHDSFSRELSSSDIQDLEVKLYKIPSYRIRFFELGANCSASPVNQELVTALATLGETGNQVGLSNLDEGAQVRQDCSNDTGSCIGGFQGSTISEMDLDYLPSGQAQIDVWLTHPKIFGSNPGISLTPIQLDPFNLTLPEPGGTLDFYVPRTEPYFQEAVACIDGAGQQEKSVCSPNIISCSGFECQDSISSTARNLAASGYLANRVRNKFSSLLASCGKQMVEVS